MVHGASNMAEKDYLWLWRNLENNALSSLH
jgi:hypothetical protein